MELTTRLEHILLYSIIDNCIKLYTFQTINPTFPPLAIRGFLYVAPEFMAIHIFMT